MTSHLPNISIPLRWRTVGTVQSGIAWHRKERLNARERDAIFGPRVYRWVLRGKTHEIDAVYIGETERFEIRLRSYCIVNVKPPTKTRRIREELKRCEDEGGTVELQFLDLESGQFILNGTLVNRFSLAEHTARRLLESVAVFAAEAEEYKVLNHSRRNVAKNDIVKLFNQSKDKGKLLDAVLQTLKMKPERR